MIDPNQTLGSEEPANELTTLAISACIQTGAAAGRYVVKLTHADGSMTTHPFSTVRAAERFVRAHLPTPPVRTTLWDFPGRHK